MSDHTHNTAPTQFIEVTTSEGGSIRFAYRRFGKTGGVPLVFNQHYTGTLDHWDPAVTDGLAKDREVILFDNAGVAASSGETPSTFGEMAANAIRFIKALGLPQVAVQAPQMVRRLILVGTGPRGADMADSQSAAIFSATYENPEDVWLKVHFGPSAQSQAAGRAFLKRKWLRPDRDTAVSAETAAAQREAVGKNVTPRDGVMDYLKTIHQPTLIVQGSNDVIIPTKNSYVMQQVMPNAQLIVYPDSNHGAFYQYPELFVAQARQFLDATIGNEAAFPAVAV